MGIHRSIISKDCKDTLYNSRIKIKDEKLDYYFIEPPTNIT